jgi:hypothetical protein
MIVCTVFVARSIEVVFGGIDNGCDERESERLK